MGFLPVSIMILLFQYQFEITKEEWMGLWGRDLKEEREGKLWLGYKNKQTKTRVLMLLISDYYKAMVLKSVRYWHEDSRSSTRL